MDLMGWHWIAWDWSGLRVLFGCVVGGGVVASFAVVAWVGSPSSLGWVFRRLRSSLRSSRSGWLCNASRSVALLRRLRSPSSLVASLAVVFCVCLTICSTNDDWFNILVRPFDNFL